MSENDGRRPGSFIDDEQIIIKPSTELIPDEYERNVNDNMLVELVCRQEDEDANDLENKLLTLGYSINRTNSDRLTTAENWIVNFVANVNEKTKEKAYDGLILIFAKVELRNEVLKNVWGNFTSAKCPALKDKPKIFIFQVWKSGPATDSHRHVLQTDPRTAYDTPSEADILIIYDKISGDSSNDFLENFQQHIGDYGHREDIINLVSLSIGSESRPLVISTMTRKFFFSLNELRGHPQNIKESHAEIKDNLEKIIDLLKNNHNKPKDKGLMSSFRHAFSSFRNKNHHGKETETDENKEENNRKHRTITEETKQKQVAGSSKEKTSTKDKSPTDATKNKPKPLKIAVDPAPAPTISPIRKTSIPVPTTPATPIRRTASRARNMSNTYDSKEDLSKKPPWR